MDFQVNLNFLGSFLAFILLESFIKFPVNPYYEPQSWFMIYIYIYIYIYGPSCMNIFAHTRMGPSHMSIPIWAAYTHMGTHTHMG